MVMFESDGRRPNTLQTQNATLSAGILIEFAFDLAVTAVFAYRQRLRGVTAHHRCVYLGGGYLRSHKGVFE